ncbi:MAG TPA: NADH:ubiquinone reductase (Na(+)-transporting) subunit D [Sumerlaeia bacterium]|nr:NADH:ubiquinone reductase (Na(+)-transporting) subunit D [Sumerlaeia bacterium]
MIKTGTLLENPICHQTLGICSALAVTGKLENTIVMCIALLLVLTCSNVMVSFLRNQVPRKVRMIAEMAIISTFVIAFDQVLKAYYYDMSKQLGPYVGLIITNCIVLGRAEACALSSRPVKAFWDGIANGLGYSVILLSVSIVRELVGSGTLWGRPVLSDGYDPCQVMVQSAGAFFVLGVVLWIMKSLWPEKT